ncbi:hypothetical protein [Promicromonospora sp. NPDC023805]|uniref:hypothetical protein n=1 Tax=Promicromonospora sp. NPDC023805 TaxID=3154696 RepID=UPI00340D95ED
MTAGTVEELATVAAEREREVRRIREQMERAIDARNNAVRGMREAGASYGDIAKALGLTRAGAVGICRKIGVE